MAMKLTREQCAECIIAMGEVMDKGYTDRVCPICGKKLIVEVSGASGDVRCETEGCFGEFTLRGI